jgi:hypothetical protein
MMNGEQAQGADDHMETRVPTQKYGTLEQTFNAETPPKTESKIMGVPERQVILFLVIYGLILSTG